jgi:hypothetical protein
VRVYQFRHIRAERKCSRTDYSLPMAVWRFFRRIARETILFYTAKRD